MQQAGHGQNLELPDKSAVELTKRLRDCLRTRYAWPEWALLEEISLSRASWGGHRVADALALGMWGGTQHHLHGFEIKATRSDWLKEVRTIGKADDAYRYCHRWWLVAPEGVATADEIPGTWGWMIPRGATLRVKRQAPVLTPEPLPMWATAHLVSKALHRGVAQRGDVAQQLVDEYERGKAAGIEQEQARYRPDELERLRTAVDRFEEVSGITIEGGRAENIGKAVRFVESGGLKRQEKQLEKAASAAFDALVELAAVVPTISARRTYRRGDDVDLAGLLNGHASASEDLL